MENNTFRRLSFLILILLGNLINAWPQSKPMAFRVISLGVKGGDDESNLSAYLLAPGKSENFICLDAGTINAGIQKAIDNKTLRGISEDIQKKQIKGYLVSHAHLDHVAGLIINSPADSSKNIYGMPYVLNTLRDKYFAWDTWANFGNEGEKPRLNKYTYTYLTEDVLYPLAETNMKVRAFELSHGKPFKSTAFLVQANENYILYLGDTGADSIEKSDKLSKLWQSVAPLINAGKLKAIFLEVSFPDEQPDNKLFGHLTPHLFFNELRKLQDITGSAALRKVSIIATHMKPPIQNSIKIKKQLQDQNKMKLKLVFPEQGKQLTIN